METSQSTNGKTSLGFKLGRSPFYDLNFKKHWSQPWFHLAVRSTDFAKPSTVWGDSQNAGPSLGLVPEKESLLLRNTLMSSNQRVWPGASHRKEGPFDTFVLRLPFNMKVMYDSLAQCDLLTFLLVPASTFKRRSPCKVTKAETTNGKLVFGVSFLGKSPDHCLAPSPGVFRAQE